MWDRLVWLGKVWLTWKIAQEICYAVAIVIGTVFVIWAWWQVSIAAGRIFRLW